MFAECTFIDQSGIQTYNTADSGITGHTSGIAAVIDHLVFQIDTDNTTYQMQAEILCCLRHAAFSDFSALCIEIQTDTL